MGGVTEEELRRFAARRGWPMDAGRIRVILPEVQRLLAAAARLRELPVAFDEPPEPRA